MKAIAIVCKRLIETEGLKLGYHLFGMVMVSLFAGIGTFLLIPLISLSGLTETTAKLPLLTPLIEALGAFPPAASLGIVLSAYAAVMLGQFALQRTVTIRNVRLMNRFGEDVRLETYRGIMNAEWPFFLRKKRTDLTNALSMEMARVIHGTFLVMQVAASLIFMVIQVGLAFWLAPGVTAFVLACGTVLAVFSNRYIKKAKALGGQSSTLAQAYLSEITDQLNGMKEIKSNNLTAYRWDGYRKLVKEMTLESAGYIRMKSGSDFLYKAASTLFISAFLYVSATAFHAQLDQLLIVVVIFARLWPIFTGLQASLQQLAAALPAFVSVTELQEECKRASERTDANAGKIALTHGVECRDVSFRYEEDNGVSALEHVNLFIPANGMTAIVGRSGAGKSTLIDVLMGLIRPQRGQVSIDGRPLDEAGIPQLRNSISYVPQDPYLFGGTIRENFMLAQPDAKEADLWEALEFASAASFVRKLPDGLDTPIGDRGIRLSGGERQRLVLARAMLRKPSILIMDEATSALDAENETNIQSALEALKGTMTVIVIAHRFSTIRSADQVVVLDEGRIVQRGSFAQLSEETDGLFQVLLGNQRKLAM
ncbi:ABC transporter ATP-binding protein [Paenibacillus sp.]|uniref:ABC transporter ATP-binding protein n=1 Tax=Paenibacillus sp. TaxID=58172 RepID=UPI0028118B19|nr:ABC transporter ATP-binding protein [Paenibacillus sp.]